MKTRASLDVLTRDLRGRPLRLDAAAAVRYVSLLKAGSFHKPAALSVGVSPQAVARWRRRGENILRRGELPVWAGGALPTKPALERLCRVLACIADGRQDPELWLAGFAWACLEAEGESESTAVLIWRKAMAERPELATRFLERRYPERWAAKPAVAAKVEATSAGTTAALVIYAPPEVEP